MRIRQSMCAMATCDNNVSVGSLIMIVLTVMQLHSTGQVGRVVKAPDLSIMLVKNSGLHL